MFRDSIIAAIRTAVAALVGFVVAFLVAQGFELDENFALNLTTVLTVFFTSLYNWLVILLEKKVDPKFGVLLGIQKAPVYEKRD
ncbi:MAG: hypothetical protein E6R04_00125 [Spirochaetes bacterium]|nr:MAG: hypothetical protein E6R04_00125 [Spirochaetota bacterium]